MFNIQHLSYTKLTSYVFQ